MGTSVAVRKTPTIVQELEKVNDQILRRAYDLFNINGGAFGRDLDNWLAAEREIIWKPNIELSEADQTFNLKIAVPGIDPKDIDIEVTPEVLLVKAETHHEHKEKKGDVHACEFECGHLFRSIQFPKEIDPEKVKAEFKNGILTISAEIAEKARAKKITVNVS